jgi:hypothetical protein
LQPRRNNLGALGKAAPEPFPVFLRLWQSVPAEHKGLGMTPKQVVKTWVEHFNARDATGLAELYHDDAINHQVTQEPVEGREAIRAMFDREFATAEMVCIIEAIHEAGEVAALEWRDPLGLRGCGFSPCARGG